MWFYNKIIPETKHLPRNNITKNEVTCNTIDKFKTNNVIAKNLEVAV